MLVCLAVLSFTNLAMSGFAGDQTLVEGVGGATLRTSSVEVTGEAIINNRKKKLIPSYELEIKGKWSGMHMGGSHGSCARETHPFTWFCMCTHVTRTYLTLHSKSILQRQSCASLNTGKLVRLANPCF
jgi:hypothetical protein